MASTTLAVVTLLHLVTLVCCITSANLKVTDNTEGADVEVKQVVADKEEDDLDSQETKWLLDPVQKKMRELEYFTTKLLSPFSTLKSPSFSYGGGYPIYSVAGGPGNSYEARYPSYLTSGVSSYSPSYTYRAPQYKPTNKFVPSYNTLNWLGKGSSSLKYQQTTSNYAPDCFYPTSFKSPATYVPSKFTYSKGTPLYVNSVSYGAPQETWTNSAVSSASGSVSFAPVVSQPSVVSSGGFLIKTSVVPQVYDGLPPSSSSVLSSIPVVPSNPSPVSWSAGSVNPSVKASPPEASWSTVSGYYPSAPSAPSVPANPASASWSSVSKYYPSGPSISIPANPPSASWATVSGSYPPASAIKVNPPTASWSTASGYYPSAPSIPAIPPTSSWSTVSNYYPTGPAAPSVPANPPSASWATVSNYYPQDPSAASAPSWPSVAGNYPTSSPISPAPVTSSTPTPPSWSSVTGSFPSPPQPPQAPPTPSPSYWSTFGNALPSSLPPAPQQYILVSTPSPAVEQDQKEETPLDEVVITPPPSSAKGNVINSLPGPQIALSQEPLYYPGSNYALSYYPNVFVITNEQRLEQPLSGESIKPSTESSTVSSTSTAESTTSSESSPALKSQTVPEVTPKPIQTSVHSISTNERSKGPLVYTVPQPVLPPAGGIFYSPPQVQNPYQVPVNFGASGSPQFVQSLPPTRALLNSYPTSVGYSYAVPNVPPPLPSSKALAPC